MFIGKAAQLSGCTVKSIRHYEAIGLLPAAQRQGNYRIYTEQSVELLIFIKCAQQLGFRLKEMQAMFDRHPGEVLTLELARAAIADKKRELMNSIDSLQRLHGELEAFEASLAHAEDQCRLGSR
ncbi:MerR family transcriptional regulator [Pseudomonas sp. PCH199]|uniref:MerR family transcriptional regulator n=1 Tax=unclassified Pseudomonas TaxID=196821 RepID=UPI000BD017B0|nr:MULTISPECIES: MerR family transcriptional regulator [unclassified Pseudomonas]MCW8276478.1 MerR family transcriptional regulator [Pseudomonas sp. PCH199]PAM83434.1 MerR family transcriptional regulator [Pseudomonas sp. ERMR1:02]